MGSSTLLIFLVGLLSAGCSALYSSSDPVVILSGDNFEDTVIGSDTAWVVEFYAAWCGHCQRLVPTWLEFARDVQGWSNVVRVAVVACSDSRNTDVCSRNNIWGYPTVKYYPPRLYDSHQYYRGRKYSGRKTTTYLRQRTLEYLGTTPVPGDLLSVWPNLRLARSETEILQSLVSTTRYLFAVVDDSSSFIGREVILDASRYIPGVVVRRVMAGVITVDSSPMSSPALLAYDLSGSGTGWTIAYRGVSRSAMTSYIRNLAGSLSSEVTETPLTTLLPDNRTQPDIPLTTAAPIDGVHMQDLESGLYYSLWVEIPARLTIHGSALSTLKQYIRVLYKYHPGDAHIVNFLNRTHTWLQTQGNSIGGQQWKDAITSLQRSDAYVPSRLRWTACRGTQDHFRGYPCSAWTLFHSLTVNAVDVLRDGSGSDAMEVLGVMRNYIRYFFSCRECAGNFADMAVTLESEVNKLTDAIMWLWRAHNRVNNRLHGDQSEDPGYPKFQFPRQEACPQCRDPQSPGGSFDNATVWRHPEVLSYLRWFYRKTSIIRDDVQTGFDDFTTAVPTQPPKRREPPRDLQDFTTVTSPPRDVYTTPTVTSCDDVSTEWSPCSASCDTGLSTRMITNNVTCVVEMETRLCNLRPCSAIQRLRNTYLTTGSCPGTFRTMSQNPLVYGNCRTVQAFYGTSPGASRVCGVCAGYCCHPVVESTVTMDLECGLERVTAKVQVQVIHRCECPLNCPPHYIAWRLG